jgi:hypothetical protein
MLQITINLVVHRLLTHWFWDDNDLCFPILHSALSTSSRLKTNSLGQPCPNWMMHISVYSRKQRGISRHSAFCGQLFTVHDSSMWRPMKEFTHPRVVEKSSWVVTCSGRSRRVTGVFSPAYSSTQAKISCSWSSVIPRWLLASREVASRGQARW